MKIKDFIKILSQCDKEEELKIDVNIVDNKVDSIYLGNTIYVKCLSCDGEGTKIYQTGPIGGFCSNGDYCDPRYEEFEDNCDICNGECIVPLPDYEESYLIYNAD